MIIIPKEKKILKTFKTAIISPRVVVVEENEEERETMKWGGVRVWEKEQTETLSQCSSTQTL